MASFEIYCPCKVKEIGIVRVIGDLPYFLWGWIHDKDPRAKCKYCGQIVKIK